MSSAEILLVAADLAAPIDGDSPSHAPIGCGVSSPRIGARSIARSPILASSAQKRTPVVLAASDPKRSRGADSENAAVPLKDQNNPDTLAGADGPLQSGSDARTAATAAPETAPADADALAAKKARREWRRAEREEREAQGVLSIPTPGKKKVKRRKREILDAEELLKRLGKKYPDDPEMVSRPPPQV